jgi:hypothetical protein
MSNESLEQRNRKVDAKLEMAAAKMAKDAEQRLAYDFDKALEEYQEEVGFVYVHICDEDVKIAKNPPLRVLNAVLQLTRDQGATDQVTRYTKFLTKILNDRLTQKILQSEASFEFIVERLVPQLFKIWGMDGVQKEESESGERKVSGS